MKKYVINYSFDENDNMYVAVCPEFFGFIAYYKNLEDLKKGCIKLLKVYSKQKEITSKNIDFEEVQTLELEM